MKKILFYISLYFTLSSCEALAPSTNKYGSAVFYTSSNSKKMRVSISNTDFNVPNTNNPENYCKNGYTGWILLKVGKHSYTITSQDGTSFKGVVDVPAEDECVWVSL